MATRSNSSSLLDDDGLALFKPVVKDLMHSEYRYLVDELGSEKQAILFPEWAERVKREEGFAAAVPFPAQHIMSSMEIATVIAGLKPCVVISHGHLQEFAKIWFENIFLPWQEKYRAQLDGVHLEGRLTPRGEVARYMDGHPQAHFGGQSCLIYRANHPLAGKVLDVFTKNPKVTGNELQQVFGYPTKEGSLKIEYQLQPPVAGHLGVLGVELCCCVALEYKTECDTQSLISVGRHFASYKSALDKMGIPIGLDIDDNRVSPEVLALVWLSASNGNVEEYMRVQQAEDAFWQRPHHPNIRQTLQCMVQYSKRWEQILASVT